jgi:hypothetical protein
VLVVVVNTPVTSSEVAPPPGGQADDQRRRPTEVIWIWVRAGVYGLGTTAGHARDLFMRCA